MSRSNLEVADLLRELLTKLGHSPATLHAMRHAHVSNGSGVPLEITIPMDVMVYGMRVTLAPVHLPVTRSGARSVTHYNNIAKELGT